eukprot:928219-Pelagomonas_calceolata.AAC.4
MRTPAHLYTYLQRRARLHERTLRHTHTHTCCAWMRAFLRPTTAAPAPAAPSSASSTGRRLESMGICASTHEHVQYF